jgi:hypothetical protein
LKNALTTAKKLGIAVDIFRNSRPDTPEEVTKAVSRRYLTGYQGCTPEEGNKDMPGSNSSRSQNWCNDFWVPMMNEGYTWMI